MGIEKYQCSRLLFMICLGMVSIVANAQQVSKSLSLEACVNYALKNNLKIRQSNADQNQLEYQIKEVKSNLLPQISGSGSIDRNIVIPTIILPGEIIGQPGSKIPAQMGTRNALDFSAQIEQVIFDPSLFQGIKIAKTNQELLQLQKTLTEEEIIYNVSSVFYEIARTKEELKNVEEMLLLQESTYDIVSDRVKQGVTRPVDLNRVQVNKNSLKSRKRNLENTVYQQTNYLKALLDIDINEDLTIQYVSPANIGNTNIASLHKNENHSEINLLEEQKDLVILQMVQEKKKYLPTLSGLFSAGYQFQSDQFKIAKDPWFSSVFIGLRLKVPVFDGFAKRNKIQQLHWQSQHIEYQIQEKKQILKADERNAIYQLETSRENVTAQKQNIELAEDNYDKTNMLYKEGLVDLSEVFNTENALLDTKIEYSNEYINHKKAEIELLKALGELKNNLQK